MCRFIENFNLMGNEAVLGTSISTEAASSSTLMMEAGGFSKILVCTHQTAYYHLPEDLDLHIYLHKNLSSHM